MSKPLVWISFTHMAADGSRGHTSSLQVLPDKLRVTGVLPHGAEIICPNKADRDKLRAWLDAQEKPGYATPLRRFYDEVKEILYPAENPEEPWEAATIEYVADAFVRCTKRLK